MPVTAVPERIGPYVVEATLGRGAMGVVYLARDTRIGRRVALKMIQLRTGSTGTSPASLDYFRRLQREAEVCAALHHPNIVTLFDVGYEQNRISYLAMEYVAGESLSDIIRRHGSAGLPNELVAHITADVLRGLSYAHGKGIVHRDIKPANVLVAHDDTAKIADFGIARPQESDMTIAGALMGTPNYMSPEQAQGLPATPRSDLFSAGVMMFELLTGAKPFAGGDVQSTIQNILHMPTPAIGSPDAKVPAEYDRFIQRLTAKLPEERFPSAQASLDALELLREGASSDTTATPTASRVAVQWWSVRASVLRRFVPSRIFWTVIVVAVVAAITPVVVIRTLTFEKPTARISRQQLEEFAHKRAALRDADLLYRGGKYDESLKDYDAYLARYPYSTVARDGAAKSRAALERAQGTRRRSAKRSPVDQLKRKLRKIFH